ncbi:2-oxo acid dehydrogenase subunit E2 [Fodinisporobacter ferrooxydans]|uniref:Dihydrolipoamide acetyltransferase component of pyruvate dehydrogenase complex n=1 Tax=Fodinisporobacter ferrooxydans TaxID=2901836 RepID=A0ABY4CHZ1_9BACL|nr:2-oxo acid dehydrogenase subunit E2 [Alicyclobacillaceae bacterium MYW30-H2]
MPDVRMPQLGESVTEGTLGKWLKQIGDKVEKYEPLVEVITDKVNAEIPSDVEGILTEILVQEGETVPVGTKIAVIEGQDVLPHVLPQKDTANAITTAASKTQAAADALETLADVRQHADAVFDGQGRFSPVVMRLMQEHRINPAMITGTGIGGRITRKDVYRFIESPNPPSVIEQPQSEPKAAVQSEMPAVEPVISASKPLLANGEDQIIPATAIRKTIAKRMVESKHTAPHAWTMVEADVTSLVKFRTKVKEEFKRREGIDLTYLPFFIKAVAESLKEFPILNSAWTDEGIVIKKGIHISIAVATEDALVVPVIHHADRLSIVGIAHAVHDLAARARAGKLTMEDVAGGTFTVNNTGAFGSILSAPIINAPQAAIITMESIVKRPVVLDDDAIAIRSLVNICLSLDHRVLDGLACGRFLQSVKRRLQEYGEHTIL